MQQYFSAHLKGFDHHPRHATPYLWSLVAMNRLQKKRIQLASISKCVLTSSSSAHHRINQSKQVIQCLDTQQTYLLPLSFPRICDIRRNFHGPLKYIYPQKSNYYNWTPTRTPSLMGSHNPWSVSYWGFCANEGAKWSHKQSVVLSWWASLFS